MKKLLAIAVAATFAAPMIASADVTVGGNLNQEYDFTSGSTTNKTIVDDGGDNEIVIKASTPLHNGMTGTAQITHDFNASGNANDNYTVANGNGASNTKGKLGIKGNFGHVTIGQVSTPMDSVDGVVGFLPADFSFGDGTGDQGINYTGAFGGVTAMALIRPEEQNTYTALNGGDDTENQVGLTYKAGPFAAGLGIASNAAATSALAKTRLALAYNGGNYSVGVQTEKNTAGAKSSVIGGKYSFGNAYVSASTGKNSGTKMNSVKLGYNLGKSTEVYVHSTDTGAANRSNQLGINQKF